MRSLRPPQRRPRTCKAAKDEADSTCNGRSCAPTCRGAACSERGGSCRAEEELQAEIAKTKAELDVAKANNLLEQKRLERWRDSISAKAAAQEAKAAQHVAKAEEREQARLTRAFADYSTELPTAVEQDFLRQQEELKHSRGLVCTEAQSRCILLLLISLVKDDGLTQTAAIQQVCAAL